MAFRVPSQVQQSRRSVRNVSPGRPIPAVEAIASTYSPREEESQEWVLFSPETAQSTAARTHTTSTERTPRTAGRSRLSDFGSLGTALRTETELDQSDLLEEDATELDSLDDGLHAFGESSTQEPTSDQLFQLHQSDPAFLPAHDGLGTFIPKNTDVQEQLWQHERFNPNKRPELRTRRRSSVQRHLESVDEMQSTDMERDRWQRIEQWRMEQSRVLLQEIEKESKRQRRRQRAGLASRVAVGTTSGKRDISDEEQSPTANQNSDSSPQTEESFWRCITRKVIRDLIGIDDSILAVIFGEALVEDIEQENQQQLLAPEQDPQHMVQRATSLGSSIRVDSERPQNLDEVLNGELSLSSSDTLWQERLLNHIARELGVLVNQIYEHPGAFSTYLHAPSSANTDDTATSTEYSSFQQRPATSRTVSHDGSNTGIPGFNPTLQDVAGANHAALWGIEEEGPRGTHVSNTEYWERELTMKMAFRYLCRSLAGKAPFSNDGTSTPTPSPTEQADQAASRRASVLRQHHPLVARADAHLRSNRSQPRRRQSHSSGAGVLSGRINTHTAPSSSRLGGSSSSPIIFRHIPRPSSSCASQSTILSSAKGPLGSGSSRHYWDLGSVGSNSAIAVGGTGGMGSWGDV